ncbi:tRNA (guanine(10)-N(2))-dimethyltransferase [Candidatus Woesearchaeota archaeon]|nr:tRNA (guanine(10)-N(2))-dimethyltransferase [Candidatus Woesearchaeota archaeon]
MTLQKIKEGEVEFYVSSEKKLSRKMQVFYNPVMSFQRDLNIALLKALDKKELRIADILAGSGVRSLRILKEVKNVEQILVNDGSPEAVKIIKKNIKNKKAVITNKNAHQALQEFPSFDYIDIDPFGSPNPFLDASIQKLKNKGILAVTATDTSALCGSYIKACQRKYWSIPLRNELMHEIGIRILARKVQLVGSQYDKALTPIFCHSTLHYMRIYFQCERGKSKVDEIIKQHEYFHYNNKTMEFFSSKKNTENDMITAGPIFTGNLWSPELVEKMIGVSEHKEFLKKILDEAKINVIGFYDMHEVASLLKTSCPKKEKLLKYGVSTHFTPTGIKSKLTIEEFKKNFN